MLIKMKDMLSRHLIFYLMLILMPDKDNPVLPTSPKEVWVQTK